VTGCFLFLSLCRLRRYRLSL